MVISRYSDYPTNETDRYDIIVIFFKVALHTIAIALYYGAHDLPSCLLKIYDDIFTIVNVIWSIAFLYVSMMYIEII